VPAGKPRSEKLSKPRRLDFPSLKNCLFRSGSAASNQKTFFQPPAGQPLWICDFFGWLEEQPALQKLFFSRRSASRHSKNFFSMLGWPAGTPKTFFQRLAGQPVRV
jgi:hypothetical protein